MTDAAPVALVVFTRDLRVADNPALSAAWRASTPVCAFVHDEALGSRRPIHERRTRVLAGCLAGLDMSLRSLGGRLEQRQGNWVEQVLKLAAQTGARTVYLSDDVTPYAQRRFARLEQAAGRSVEVCRTEGLAVVPPGTVTPAGGDHYRIFTPFYRRWLTTPRRQLLRPPPRFDAPDRIRPPSRPGAAAVDSAAAARLGAWAERIVRYADHRDDLAEPATSRLSQDLHFGCLSPIQVEAALAALPGADPFLRQLCWRDFYLQILAARPDAAWSDFVERTTRPREDPEAFEAWCAGVTGIPIVDAAMRQLKSEGFISNRARMIAASFLTRHLELDWRAGARHFLEHLADADVALNNLNWQWMAGHGTGTNPRRVLSPTRQARRYDPNGVFVGRHVPELRGLDRTVIHEPWRLGRRALARLGYPLPIVSVGSVAA